MTQRALDVAGFCAAYKIGKTLFYEEVKAGHLPIRKVGRRTLILVADAERWERSLVGKFMGRTKTVDVTTNRNNDLDKNAGGEDVCRNDVRPRPLTPIYLAVSNA